MGERGSERRESRTLTVEELDQLGFEEAASLVGELTVAQLEHLSERYFPPQEESDTMSLQDVFMKEVLRRLRSQVEKRNQQSE